MLKVYVVGSAKHYSAWIENHELTDNLEEANIVLFTGGEDVDPSLYGCETHHTTYSNIDRDLAEKEVFEKVNVNIDKCFYGVLSKRKVPHDRFYSYIFTVCPAGIITFITFLPWAHTFAQTSVAEGL